MKEVRCRIEFDLVRAIFFALDVIIGFGIGFLLKEWLSG